MPNIGTWHFGTSVVRSTDLRYISVSEDRSADLGTLDTHTHTYKSTTHTPIRGVHTKNNRGTHTTDTTNNK